jgi:hypothetical protein
MPATKKPGKRPAKRPFKVKVHMSLRYIMRLTEDGYEAWCVDAGAVGIGDNQQESLDDLITNLEALHKFSSENGGNMLTVASEEEERLIARMAGGQPVEPEVLGYGVVRLVEVMPTAQGVKQGLPSPSGFEISLHRLVAA